MFKAVIFSSLLIGSLVPVLLANSYPGEGTEESKNKKFDFLVFAQIWPVTSCDIWESKSESNTCFLPQEGKTLWPFSWEAVTIKHNQKAFSTQLGRDRKFFNGGGREKYPKSI